MSDGELTLGIDMGGTNIRYALVDAAGHIVFRGRAPMPQRPAERVDIPGKLARQFQEQVSAVGLAIAGTVTGGMLTWSANLGLAEIDFAAEMQRNSTRPVTVINDARAAGYAEAVVGAGGGAPNVLAITVGTGIGGALIMDRALIDGTGTAGEIGHMVIQPNGRTCACGRFGCWERYVGGRALTEDAAGLFPDAPDPLARLIHEAEVPGSESERVLARAADLFGLGLDNLQAILAPDVIVLGGGIIARDGVVAATYRASAAGGRWGARTNIRTSKLGDAAGQIGAALLARTDSE